MFCDFYKLKENPFNIIPNPGILYESEKHALALIYLRYGFSENMGLVLFTGDIGTGKTTLLKYLLTELTDETEVAVVFNTNVGAEELLRLIMIEFEVEGVGTDKSRNLDLLNQYLIDVYQKGRRCLLVIDEGQNLSADALEEVRLLSNLQTDTQPLLQIVLAGQPELRETIQSSGFEQLAQRVAIKYHLTPLSREELGEYIQYRLKMAGSSDGKLFSDAALDLLYEAAGGVPRSTNVLCNAALVYGYADSLEQISKSVMQQVIDDNLIMQPGLEPGERAVEPGHFPVAAGESLGKGDESVLNRVRALEGQVANLTAMVSWQAGQIDGSLAKGHEKIIKSLTDLLDKERVRSEEYYGRFIALSHEQKRLKSQIESRSGTRMEKHELEEKGEVIRKKSLLKAFSSLFFAFCR